MKKNKIKKKKKNILLCIVYLISLKPFFSFSPCLYSSSNRWIKLDKYSNELEYADEISGVFVLIETISLFDWNWKLIWCVDQVETARHHDQFWWKTVYTHNHMRFCATNSIASLAAAVAATGQYNHFSRFLWCAYVIIICDGRMYRYIEQLDFAKREKNKIVFNWIEH